MKIYDRYCRGKLLVYILLWIFFSGYWCQAFAEGPPKATIRIIPDGEVVIVLQLISSEVRDNYERINTWAGEIDKKITWLHTGSLAEDLFKNATDARGEMPESLLQKAEDKITFAVDANKNYVYVDTLRDKPGRYFNYHTGVEVGNSGPTPIWSSVIVRPDSLLKAEAFSFEKATGRLLHKRAIKGPTKRVLQDGLYEGRSDPRKAFFPGADLTWDSIDNLIKRINTYGNLESDGYSLQVEEQHKGDISEYKVIQPWVVNLERSKPEHYAITTKVFSSQCGFNMTYWNVSDGSGQVFHKYTWEYELIDGIYLPKRIVENRYNSSGEMTHEYDSTYKNNKVNQEIPTETFEYSGLKLRDGDIFVDEILNKHYRYRAATQTLEPVDVDQ